MGRNIFAVAIKPLSVTINSVGSQTAAAGNVGAALLFWPKWLTEAVREQTLLFVTERDIRCPIS